jgi:addiction module HigA family antidote
MLHNSPGTSLHPGSYLQELLIWRHVSAEEFADITGIGKTKIVDIIKKRRAIDKNVSEGLAAYFGNSSKFWLDLQEHFDQRKWGACETINTPATRPKENNRNEKYS